MQCGDQGTRYSLLSARGRSLRNNEHLIIKFDCENPNRVSDCLKRWLSDIYGHANRLVVWGMDIVSFKNKPRSWHKIRDSKKL